MKFWDIALEYGANGTKSALTVLKLLSMTLFGQRICPVDECDYVVPENTPLCAHFIQNHVINLPAGSTPDFFVDLIVSIGNDLPQALGLCTFSPLK